VGIPSNNSGDISAPRIILGGLQMGADPNPPALVAISYPSPDRAQGVAEYLMSIQDGTTPFKSSPNVCAGDTVIKVYISPTPVPSKGHLCQVMAKADPRHLTYCFYVASYVSEEQLSVFYSFFDLANHYVLTVAHGDKLLLDTINLIKYTINRRGV
jgi:hypothetical protein